tara:strand:- start:341 stop:499 length:159 start_codon:yes stop_codon:yes gene_type:complete
MQLNIYLELLLRTVGVFLSVFFTVGWGKKSNPVFDEILMFCVVAAAIALNYI